MKLVVVLTTFPSKETADSVAEKLVEERLVACAQVLEGVESVYWWEGKVEKGKEWLVLLKTTEEAYKRVEERLAELHPYEVPEIVAIPSLSVYEPYLNWLRGEIG